jgi:hypothetical protein
MSTLSTTNPSNRDSSTDCSHAGLSLREVYKDSQLAFDFGVVFCIPMAASIMSEKTHFEIPLFDIGPDGAGFRIENDGDELQRKHGDQYQDSDLMYQAGLFSVTHGMITPEGNRGALIIMDFHFISVPQGRRFKHVDITVAFGREKLPIGSSDKEPIVIQMAPHGAFALDESAEQEVTVEAHGSAQGGPSLATIGIGGSF